MAFAVRPPSTSTTVPRETHQAEAGSTAASALFGDWQAPTGPRPAVDPAIFGIDASDFVTHAAPYGLGSAGADIDRQRTLTGIEADELIATVPFIHELVKGQIEKGFTGANLVRFYTDREAYAFAWFMDSAEVATVGGGILSGEALKQARWAAARRLAASAPGFTSARSRRVHIYTPDAPGFVTIHEMIHAYTDTNVLGTAVFNEGLADYFTGLICRQNEIPFHAAYSQEHAAMSLLAGAVGDQALASFTFGGHEQRLASVLDSKGEQTWHRYKRAIMARRFDDAASLLWGAKDLYESTESTQEAAESALDKGLEAYRHSERERQEATWGRPGTDVIRIRMTRRETHAGVKTGIVQRGGKHGVRRNWTAAFVKQGGTTIPTTIIDLESNRTWVALPDGHEGELDEVELYPAL